MIRNSHTFIAELGLQRANHAVHEWDDDPGSEILRAGLIHPVLQRMLAEAEALAPFLKLSTDVVFSLLRDLVIEESEGELTTPGPGGTPGRRSVSSESTGEDDRE